MAQFQDRTGTTWAVNLDAPTLRTIQDYHQILLTDLEKDSLLALRTDPLVLVAVIYLICKPEIDAKSLSEDEFARLLPSPPDPMLEAIEQAIVDFFPSGQASHVREVLTSFAEMKTKTDQMTIQQMRETINDPNTAKRLRNKGRREIQKAMDEMFPLDSQPERSGIEDLSLSMRSTGETRSNAATNSQGLAGSEQID